jgi:plastocyanin
MSVLGIIVALIVLVVAACGGDDESASPTSVPAKATPTDTPAASESSDSGATKVSVINQDPGGSGSYRFSPKDFKFSMGETVEFTITAETEFHTFTVDDLEIDVSLSAGQSEVLTFTFNKPGTYKLICIPHEALGMTGTIVVE